MVNNINSETDVNLVIDVRLAQLNHYIFFLEEIDNKSKTKTDNTDSISELDYITELIEQNIVRLIS